MLRYLPISLLLELQVNLHIDFGIFVRYVYYIMYFKKLSERNNNMFEKNIPTSYSSDIACAARYTNGFPGRIKRPIKWFRVTDVVFIHFTCTTIMRIKI